MKKITCYKRIKLIAIIIIQVIMCILVGTQKKSFFCDETYSYGLANSENYAFIDPETAKEYSETGWVDKMYFESYVEVTRDVPFSLNAAFENQKKDVHPPLYYCLLHVFSLFNNAVFSKWTGLALNFIFLVLIDFLMVYISNFLLKDIRLSLIVLFFWTFSGAGLSNIMLIRMYMMLTCEMLAYVAIHIKILKKRKIGIAEILSILLLIMCGGLTHYYFYLFVFCFSAPICIYLLMSKEIKKMFLYGINLCVGAIGALCIFPHALIHIFRGYRGTEVIDNLAHGRNDEVIEEYLDLINNSIFAGKFKGCFVLVLFLLIVGVFINYFANIEWTYNKKTKIVNLKVTKMQHIICREIHFELKDELIMIILLILSYAMFALVAVKGSKIVHNRYIYPVYPIIALMVIMFVNRILKFFIRVSFAKIVLLLAITGVLCIGSIFKYGIDFMYTEYDGLWQQAQETKETDCLLYYGDDGWLDVYTLFPLRLLHDKTYFMRSDEINNVAEIISKRDTENELIVCLPSYYLDDDVRNILDRISEQMGGHSYRMIYEYEYLQEWIIEMP